MIMIFLPGPAVILDGKTVTNIHTKISNKLGSNGSVSPYVKNAGEHPSAFSMRF